MDGLIGVVLGAAIGIIPVFINRYWQRKDVKKEKQYDIIEEVIRSLGKIKNLIMLLRGILHGYCSTKDAIIKNGDRTMSQKDKEVFFYKIFEERRDKEGFRPAQIYQEINLIDFKLMRLKKYPSLHQNWEQKIMDLALSMIDIKADVDYEEQFAKIDKNYPIVFKLIDNLTKQCAEITKIK